MKLKETRIKEIILEEVQIFLEQPEIVKKLQNAGRMSMETFKKFIDNLAQEISVEPATAMDDFVELALELKKTGWSMKYWESFSETERQLLLRTTYPGTPYHEALDMMTQSFLSPKIAQLIYKDVLLVVNKVEELKRGVQPGEYLGPEGSGDEPKSPYWKEFLEEAIEEEIGKQLEDDE